MTVASISQTVTPETGPVRGSDSNDSISYPAYGTSSTNRESGENSLDNAVTAPNMCENLTDITTAEFPEGGLRAWGVVLGGFLTQFCSFGYNCAFGVYQDYYTRIYMTKYSPSAISWIGSVDAFLTVSTGLIGGRLYDKGHWRFLLYGGSFLMALSLFMLSFVKPNQYFGAFLCQGMGIGLGGGMIYVPSFALVSHYFDKRRAMAMPIVTAGVSLGSVVTPLMINELFGKPSLSFATVTRLHATLMTVVLILACILMRPRLPHSKEHANLTDCLKRFSRDSAYMTMAFGFLLFGVGISFPLFYVQLAATTHGLDKKFAFYSLVIMNASGFVARMLCGPLTNKISVNTLAIVSAVVCGSVTFGFASIGSVASITVVGVLYGAFFGIYVGTMAPLAASLTDNPAELGLRMGIAFAFAGIGEVAGPPIMGALLGTRDYHWWRPALVDGMIILCAGVCFTAVKLIVRKRAELQCLRVDQS